MATGFIFVWACGYTMTTLVEEDYGSNAGHIPGMSDVDRNYFVLLGGQVGHIGSTTFLDQTDLWLQGAYIRLPLRIVSVRERFPPPKRIAEVGRWGGRHSLRQAPVRA